MNVPRFLLIKDLNFVSFVSREMVLARNMYRKLINAISLLKHKIGVFFMSSRDVLAIVWIRGFNYTFIKMLWLSKVIWTVLVQILLQKKHS